MYKETRKLQSYLFFIAKEIKRICNKYGIKYIIFGGSFLGAVRHKGFIPWDDDFDFAMLRNDYIMFIEACKHELNEEVFFLQTDESDKLYGNYYAKIRLRNTQFIEEAVKDVNINHGIFVDVFPFDNLVDKRVFCYMRILNKMIDDNCGNISTYNDNSIKSFIKDRFKYISYIFPLNFLKQIRKALLLKYDNTYTKYVYTPFFLNKAFDVNWFLNVREYYFEGELFYGPENYDAFLSYLYGDYMIIPPVDQRRVHTNYTIKYNNILVENLDKDKK